MIGKSGLGRQPEPMSLLLLGSIALKNLLSMDMSEVITTYCSVETLMASRRGILQRHDQPPSSGMLGNKDISLLLLPSFPGVIREIGSEQAVLVEKRGWMATTGLSVNEP